MVNFDNMNLIGPFTNLYNYVKTYVQYVVKVITFEMKNGDSFPIFAQRTIGWFKRVQSVQKNKIRQK